MAKNFPFSTLKPCLGLYPLRLSTRLTDHHLDKAEAVGSSPSIKHKQTYLGRCKITVLNTLRNISWSAGYAHHQPLTASPFASKSRAIIIEQGWVWNYFETNQPDRSKSSADLRESSFDLQSTTNPSVNFATCKFRVDQPRCLNFNTQACSCPVFKPF